MRWPWQRHHADVDTARAAAEKARRDRAIVEKVATRAERLAQRNGFGAAITKAMGHR